MNIYRITNLDNKTIDYVSAKTDAQAKIAGTLMYPKQKVLVKEADQWEIDSLIRSHSYPVENE